MDELHAMDVVTLTQQYGEEWLLPGEVAQFYKHGVPNIVCVQPFGCLPNHVVAKGLSKRLKEKYPDLTPNDLRLSSYLRMNFTSKEIAQLLNISGRAVEIGRYRLRRKMQLHHNVNLTEFLIQQAEEKQ